MSFVKLSNVQQVPTGHKDLLSYILWWWCGAGADWTQWSFELCFVMMMWSRCKLDTMIFWLMFYDDDMERVPTGHNDLLSYVLWWWCGVGANWTQWSFDLCFVMMMMMSRCQLDTMIFWLMFCDDDVEQVPTGHFNDFLSFILWWRCLAGTSWIQWSFEFCFVMMWKSVIRNFSLRNFLWQYKNRKKK